MRKVFPAALGLGAIVIAVPLAANAASATAWHGKYVWDESLGRIGGSVPSESIAVFATYTLTLGPGRAPTACGLNIEGYQTYRKLSCTATPQGNMLIVKFARAERDAHGPSYARGAPLFTLVRARGGIVTRLQALSPLSDATARHGRLFRPVG